MAAEIVELGAIEAESSWTTGTSHKAPPSGTQQQRTHELVYRELQL